MNQNEYNQCVEKHADDLYRFILKNLQQEALAKDIIQNTFLVLWQKKEEVEAEKAKAYLFTTGYRKMIDEIRKNEKMKLVKSIPENAKVTNGKEQSDLKKILHQALETLPEIQKQLVLLKDYEGYNYEELATITGLNAGQVKTHLFRARTSLKKILVSVETSI